MNREILLRSIYYDIGNPASFSSVEKLYQAARNKDPSITRGEVEEYLSAQNPYTLHRRVVRKFKRNPIVASHPEEMIQADLIDVQKYAKENDGYKYILTIIDVFSKRAFAIPLKSKTGPEVARAFRNVFQIFVPEKLQTDAGKEFLNIHVQNILKEYHVFYYTATNEITKCAVVERFQRTLLSRLHKYFTASRTTRYIDVLDDFLKTYNNTKHSSIGMTPKQVNEHNTSEVFFRLYGAKDKRELLKKRLLRLDKIHQGDTIRIPTYKDPFRKGYRTTFSDTLYKVENITPGDHHPMYSLKEKGGKRLKGRYYPYEVQKISNSVIKRSYIPAEKRKGRASTK